MAMTFYELILIVGILAVSHSIFLCFVLLRLSKKLANRLLVFLLFFLSIRIGTCIAGLLDTNLEFLSAYFGAVTMLGIGPLFYLYQTSLWNPSYKLSITNYYHFIPSVLALALFYFVHLKIAMAIYIFSLLVMVIYVVLGILKFYASGNSVPSKYHKRNWALYFNSGIAVLTIIFIGQLFLLDPYAYMFIVVGSAFLSYALSIWSVKYVKLFMPDPKRKTGSKEKLTKLGKKIEEVLEANTLFADPQLTVSKLAEYLNKPPYLVSLAINQHYQKSFPEIVNELRIKRAEHLLSDHEKEHYTIEAIAYESGFNTLSAFYSGFKKINMKTPLQYKKETISEKSRTKNSK